MFDAALLLRKYSQFLSALRDAPITVCAVAAVGACFVDAEQPASQAVSDATATVSVGPFVDAFRQALAERNGEAVTSSAATAAFMRATGRQITPGGGLHSVPTAGTDTQRATEQLVQMRFANIVQQSGKQVDSDALAALKDAIAFAVSAKQQPGNMEYNDMLTAAEGVSQDGAAADAYTVLQTTMNLRAAAQRAKAGTWADQPSTGLSPAPLPQTATQAATASHMANVTTVWRDPQSLPTDVAKQTLGALLASYNAGVADDKARKALRQQWNAPAGTKTAAIALWWTPDRANTLRTRWNKFYEDPKWEIRTWADTARWWWLGATATYTVLHVTNIMVSGGWYFIVGQAMRLVFPDVKTTVIDEVMDKVTGAVTQVETEVMVPHSYVSFATNMVDWAFTGGTLGTGAIIASICFVTWLVFLTWPGFGRRLSAGARAILSCTRHGK